MRAFKWFYLRTSPEYNLAEIQGRGAFLAGRRVLLVVQDAPRKDMKYCGQPENDYSLSSLNSSLALAKLNM